MRKKLLLTFCFVLVAITSFCQEKNKYLTIYSNGYIEKVEHIQGIGKKYHIKGFCPSIAYSQESSNLIFQIDLMPVYFATFEFVETVNNGDQPVVLDGEEQKQIESSLGLTTKYRFVNKAKFKINAVCDNRIFYQYNSYSPYLSNAFPWTEKKFGWSILIGFELEKSITDMLSISIMPTYAINDYYHYKKVNNNPSIVENKRTVSDVENSFNPVRWNLKIGFKIKI